MSRRVHETTSLAILALLDIKFKYNLGPADLRHNVLVSPGLSDDNFVESSTSSKEKTRPAKQLE